ncbi:MAG: hypothetical protein ACE5KK_06485 [Candidatus Brocadiales bacterium]
MLIKQFLYILLIFTIYLPSSPLVYDVDAQEKYKVLFDAGHAQSAGRHADWIIDDNVPVPKPPNPSSPEDWSGGISSWAYALYRTGRYDVESTNRPLSFGNPENPQDLSRYSVLILCEPNTDLTPSERAAVVTFVKRGGGVFLIADHFNSDRNNDGIDSTGIFNKLESYTGMHFQETGENNSWLRGGHYTANFSLNDVPVLYGPFGMVEMIYLNGFGTISLVKSPQNTTARGHIWLKGARQVDLDIIFATSRLGRGRIAAISDSSPADDGTTNTPGRRLYNNWSKANNGRLLLNTTEFLAGR